MPFEVRVEGAVQRDRRDPFPPLRWREDNSLQPMAVAPLRKVVGHRRANASHSRHERAGQSSGAAANCARGRPGLPPVPGDDRRQSVHPKNPQGTVVQQALETVDTRASWLGTKSRGWSHRNRQLCRSTEVPLLRSHWCSPSWCGRTGGSRRRVAFECSSVSTTSPGRTARTSGNSWANAV